MGWSSDDEYMKQKHAAEIIAKEEQERREREDKEIYKIYQDSKGNEYQRDGIFTRKSGDTKWDKDEQ